MQFYPRFEGGYKKAKNYSYLVGFFLVALGSPNLLPPSSCRVAQPAPSDSATRLAVAKGHCAIARLRLPRRAIATPIRTVIAGRTNVTLHSRVSVRVPQLGSRTVAASASSLMDATARLGLLQAAPHSCAHARDLGRSPSVHSRPNALYP